ncbi:hypothetical protein BC828DRAFT_394744 [Blastocladiella britannica]|nr:hypothetical protein BC828DRAFT_394744 [Blastocladiella britannica]
MLGFVLTVAAVVRGISAFRAGDSKTSQLMMRYRIGAQAFTMGAALYGLYFYSDKYQQDRLHKLEARSVARAAPPDAQPGVALKIGEGEEGQGGQVSASMVAELSAAGPADSPAARK